ncbi:MAG TPA: CYTH domain-containing protein [Pseudonocardiaceae bacterium]|nr:CYTH domain-containing protein [Pseudonocardiaceae bacterium]
MAVEIERKFLVADDWTPPADSVPDQLRQGYLTPASATDTEIRLRGAGDRELMTVKRSRAATGANVRDEVEFPLPAGVFDELWPLTDGQQLTKLRYPVPIGDHLATVDVYTGRHTGLRVVEVEFDSEPAAAEFTPPAWFGPEITGDPRYANRLLASEDADS